MLTRDTDLGLGLYRAHSIWALVLESWMESSKQDQRWRDIEFDKLAHLSHIVWNALWTKSLVSFKLELYNSAPGVHGPGPALRAANTKSPIFAVRAIEMIQEAFSDNQDVCLFSLVPDGHRPLGRLIIPGRESQWKHSLHQSIGALPPAFSPEDVETATRLGRCLAQLTSLEIRALGTHVTLGFTLEGIEYNVYIHMARTMLARSPGGAGKAASAANRVEVYMEEVRRKTRDNQTTFEAARGKLMRPSKGRGDLEPVRETILEVVEPPESIWGSEKVRAWVAELPKLDGLVATWRDQYPPNGDQLRELANGFGSLPRFTRYCERLDRLVRRGWE